MPLSPEIINALETLSRGSECIGAVLDMSTEENRFTRALRDLQRLSEDQDIPMAIVGGLGAIHYGYPAATQDIDIAVGRDHLQSVIIASQRFGFKVAWESKLGWHMLTHDDVEINIVPEGSDMKFEIPSPLGSPQQFWIDHIDA